MKRLAKKLVLRLLGALCVWMISHFALAYADDIAAVSPNDRPLTGDSDFLATPNDSSQIDSFLKKYELANPAAVKPDPAPVVTKPDPVVAPSKTEVKPNADTQPDPADAETEAGTCPDGKCSGSEHKKPVKVVAVPQPQLVNGGVFHSGLERCLSNAILAGAKYNMNHTGYHHGFDFNHWNSTGKCAMGVRSSLNAAGAFTGGGLGNAIDFNARERLAQIGFKNFIREYPDPETAPPGAVLVFAGPNTGTYLRTGYEGVSGRKGDWLGHVTIKGDDGLYYTDGRTEEPAIGWPGNKTRRRLVGVYLMQKCVYCSNNLRRKCGG